MILEAHVAAAPAGEMTLYMEPAKRLLLACALGGLVGLERESRHKDAGLRINLLICLGAALFTFMSPIVAGEGNKAQIASNIVQGIGFLGAGLILHTRNRTLGLASASTVWVVAAVGIACGAGHYAVATFATVVLVLALFVVGRFERQLGWKKVSMIYEVRAEVDAAPAKDMVDAERAGTLAEGRERARQRMFSCVLHVLDSAGIRLHVLDSDTMAGMERMSFSVMATKKLHNRLLHELRSSDETDQVMVFRDLEDN